MTLERFDLKNPYRHVLGVAALLVLVVAAAVVVVWSFAHTLARNADTIQASSFAATLSPLDPRARFAYANDLEKTFDLSAIDRSLSEYEDAVALTPHNFLYWLALGQARERAGERSAAETAYRRALELAPNYGQTEWALGNNLLRQGRVEEGIQLIREAVKSDPSFATPAVIAVMQVFDGDVERVSDALGESPLAAAELSRYLVNEGRLDQAVSVWDRLPAEAKISTLRAAGIAIRDKLIDAKRFRDAVKVSSSVEADVTKHASVGSITNGGFEGGVAAQRAELFDWRVGQSYPIYGLAEGQKKEGRYSLLVRFPTSTRLDFETISQTVAVEPGTSYELLLSYRSELSTRAEFRWEVVSAASGERLTVSEPLTSGAGWQEVTLEFIVPSNSDGATIRLVRDNCDSPACNIVGSLWFDDFRVLRR